VYFDLQKKTYLPAKISLNLANLSTENATIVHGVNLLTCGNPTTVLGFHLSV